jgi:predicted Zn-dependent peptidase
LKTQEITVVPYEEAMRELSLCVEQVGSVSELATQTGVSHTLIHTALRGSVQAGPKVLEIIGLKPVRVLQKVEPQGK